MRKRYALLFTVLLVLSVSLSGCGQSGKAPSSAAADAAGISNQADSSSLKAKNKYNEICSVYDSGDNMIGQIERSGAISLVGGRLFYPNYSERSNDEAPIKEYYLYDPKTQENKKLGSVENYVSEAERVYINGHIYTIVTTRDQNADDRYLYNLIDFDLEAMTMETILSEQDSYLYNAMEPFNDDLLVIRKSGGSSKIVKYDIEERSWTELYEYSYDEASHTGDTTRQLYYQDGVISVLRLHMEGEENASLFIDRFDEQMKPLSSADISGIFTTIGAEQAEIRQPVTEFISDGDIIFYENRSVSYFLGKISSDGIVPITDNEADTLRAEEAVVRSDPYILFCECYDENNTLYRLDKDTGELTETAYFKSDKRYCLSSVYRFEDTVLIEMENREADTADERDTRLYLTEIKDLF